MTSKAKLKQSDGQTNIEKYRVAAHKMLQNIIAKQICYLLRHQKAEKQDILYENAYVFIIEEY